MQQLAKCTLGCAMVSVDFVTKRNMGHLKEGEFGLGPIVDAKVFYAN